MATGDQRPMMTPEMIEAALQECARYLVPVTEVDVKLIYTAMRSKAQKCDCQDGE